MNSQRMKEALGWASMVMFFLLSVVTAFVLGVLVSLSPDKQISVTMAQSHFVINVVNLIEVTK